MASVIGGEARAQSVELWSATLTVELPAHHESQPDPYDRGYNGATSGGYGSLSPTSFTAAGQTYHVASMINNTDPTASLSGTLCTDFQLDPMGAGSDLPGIYEPYSIYLSSGGGSIGGELWRPRNTDGRIISGSYCVRTPDLVEGRTYTVRLMAADVRPVVSVEPVQTRTPAGEAAEFRVIVSPFAPRRLNVRVETIVKRLGQGRSRNGWVSIPGGAKEATYTVGTNGNTEQVVVEVQPSSGYRVAASPNHRAVVEVGDVANVSTVQVRTMEDTITEGETAVFVISAEPAPATALTVTVNVPRAPAANHVYEPDSRFGTGKPVVIPAGRSGIRLEFRTADDDVGEESGYIEVTLDPTGEPGWRIDNPAGRPRYASARVSILDNDRVALMVSASSESIVEGESATFSVTSSTPPGSAPFDGNVDLTLNVVADGDFGVTTGPVSLQIPGGQTQVSHSVTTTDDNVAEDAGEVTASVSCTHTTRCVVESSALVEVRDNEPEVRVQPQLITGTPHPFGSEPIIREGDPRVTGVNSELSFWLTKSHASPLLVNVKNRICIHGGFSLGGIFSDLNPCREYPGIEVRDSGKAVTTIELIDDPYYQPAPGRLTFEILANPAAGYHVPADPKHRIATWIIENDDPPELPVHEWNFWVNNNLPNAPPVCWSAYPGAAKYNAYVTDQHNRQVSDNDITGRCIRPGGSNTLVVTALDGEGMAITQPSNPVCTSGDERSVWPCDSPPAPWLNPNFGVNDTSDPPQIVWDPYPGAEEYRLEFRRPTLTRDPYAAAAAPMDDTADEYTVRARAELGGDAVTAWTKWFHTCRPPKLTVGGDRMSVSRDPHPGCTLPVLRVQPSRDSHNYPFGEPQNIVEGASGITFHFTTDRPFWGSVQPRFRICITGGYSMSAPSSYTEITECRVEDHPWLTVVEPAGTTLSPITIADDAIAQGASGRLTLELLEKPSVYHLPADEDQRLATWIIADNDGSGGNPGGNTGSQGWVNPNFRVNATTDPPRVEWDSYPNASGYTVELTRPISSSGREDGGYLQMSNAGPEYTLRVKAHFTDGAETEWTDWFNTCGPPAVNTAGPSEPPSCTTAQPAQSWDPNFSVNAGTTPPQIEWAGFSGATGYTVEFTAPISWTGRKDGGFAEMSSAGPYYRMRAMAHAASGDSPWTEWFQTCKPPHTATASPPTSDADCSAGATGTAGWDPAFSVNEDTSPPRIEWTAYSGATGYTVEFTAPINWTGRKDSGYAEMSAAGPEYTMRAMAHGNNGDTSWTAWFNTCRPPYEHQGGPEAAPDCVDPTAGPTASAGADVTAKRGEENVELLGTAEGTALTYQWGVVNASHLSLLELFVPEPVPARVPRTCEADRVWTETGPEAAWIGNADQATACFTVPRRRDVADTTSLDDGHWFELELQVTDTSGATASDRMRLTIEGTTWTADGEAAASSAPSSHWTRDDFEYWDTDANEDLTCAEAISRDEGLRLPAHRDNRDGTAGIYEWLERRTSSDHDGDGVSCEGAPNPDGYVPMTVVPALPFPGILMGLAAMWLAYRRAARRA